MSDALKLAGIAVVAVGLVARANPLLVVLAAGVATGLAAGMGPRTIAAEVGRLFVDNRFMTLPVILLLPVVGLLERHGLQERAAQWIERAAGATAGRVMLAYQTMRELSSMVGLNIGGHASMIRPLVAPMAEGAARAKLGAVPRALVHRIRAHAAASENWGNFFADDILVAVGPVLLMKGVFDAAHVAVTTWELGAWGLPTATAAWLAGYWRYRALDRRIARSAIRDEDAP